MEIVIAGGGIGGLTTALCCAHFGHKVTVLETTSAYETIGAGIQLPPNALMVFDVLGLSESLKALAFKPDAIETRLGEAFMGRTGRKIFKVPLNVVREENADYKAKAISEKQPYLHIYRADYISVLHAAVTRSDRIEIQFNTKVLRYSQSNDRVKILVCHKANAEPRNAEIESDLLIGADGIHSTVRTQMLQSKRSKTSADYTGSIAWRCVVKRSQLTYLPPKTACAWFGKGKHAVTYYLRKGALVNFVGVVEQRTWDREDWLAQGTYEDALNDFKDWDPVLTGILNACRKSDDGQLFKWALHAHDPLESWSEGRVTLLGDAAHAMLPFLAQGAAMAVEDAWCLSKCITDYPQGITLSLQHYESLRIPRTTKVQKKSAENARIFHQKTKLGQLMTYSPMFIAGRLFPRLIQARLDWLYKYNIVAEMHGKHD